MSHGFLPMNDTHFNPTKLSRAIVLSLTLTSYVQAEVLTGRVMKVADGDTVTVLDGSNMQHKIRLTGVDAPEKQQAFGQKSKQSLSNWVFNKQVTVEFDKKDRYGRTLGKIVVNEVDVNLEQIKAGMAWHYKYYQREQTAEDPERYSRAEEDARSRKIGLWKDIDPLAPWEYRKRKHKR